MAVIGSGKFKLASKCKFGCIHNEDGICNYMNKKCNKSIGNGCRAYSSSTIAYSI
jgi:hypothetical protein